METPVLKWMRYGVWTAHLYVDGKQACRTKHGNFRLREGQIAPKVPTEVTSLTEHGVPFGKSCQICLRRWGRLRHPKPAAPPPAPPRPWMERAARKGATPWTAPKPTISQSKAQRMLDIVREIELLKKRVRALEREFEKLLNERD